MYWNIVIIHNTVDFAMNIAIAADMALNHK